MPIYEYACQECGHQFEALILKTSVPACPECKGLKLERLLSLPSVRSEGTHRKMLANSKKRDGSQAAEQAQAQRMYEASHDDG